MADGVTITEINISATANTLTAQKNLDRLAHTINRLASSTKVLGGVSAKVDSMVTGLKRLQDVKLGKLIPQMQTIAKAMGAFSGLDHRSISASAKMLMAQSRQAEIKYKYQRAATKQAEEERKAKMIGGAKKSDVVPHESERKPRGNGAEHLKEIAKQYGAVGRASRNAAKGAAKFLLSLPLAPLKHLGSSLKSIVSRLRGFFSSVKRIAVYRAIRAALKEITQAFREGTDNLYQYSKAIDGQFAQSMDTLATSALYAKNSLAAMASPLINALAPAVDFIIDKFVDLVNTVNELIASLTGASTWTKALKYPKEYAEAADGANGKAKELRATLLGFDEINRLDDNKRGSRGSAADALDYSKMFEEQVVNANAKGIVARLKEAFTTGDFYSIGNDIGEKIKRGLDNIPWESVQERVKKNALSASSFINGIIDTEGLPDALGTTIAEAFNTVTLKISTFFTNTKWDKVGEFIGDTLSTAIEKIDKQQLADAFFSVIGAAIDLAWGLLESHPIIGTVALLALGLKWGGILGTGIKNSVAQTDIAGSLAVPKSLSVGVTCVVTFTAGYKVGNKIFNSLPESAKDFLGWLTNKALNLVGLGEDTSNIEHLEYKDLMYYDEEFGRYFATPDNKMGLAMGFGKPGGGVFDDIIPVGANIKPEVKPISPEERERMWREARQQLIDATRGFVYDFSVGFEARWGITPKEAFDNLATNLKTAWNNSNAKKSLDEIKTSVTEWFANLFKPENKTSAEIGANAGKDFASNFAKQLNPIDTTMTDKGKSWGKSLKDGILSFFTGNSLGEKIAESIRTSLSFNVTTQNGGSVRSILKIDKVYANGGYPETGSVFLAGERGAELISTSSHGTQVANRDQISASVAAGMQEATEESNALLREQNALLQALLDKDPVAPITTDSITAAMRRSNLRSGRAVVSMGG